MQSNKTKNWVGAGAFVLSGATSAAIAAPMSSVEAGFDSNSGLEVEIAIESSGSSLLAQGGEGGEAGASSFPDTLGGPALVEALQGGRYIIYFRHAQTDEDYADQADPNLDLSDCSTQRTLSEAGWQQARAIGAAEVYSSEYCRAWQTADLAFGRYEKAPTAL